MRHVLYFTADWCQPCKRVRPIVEEINRDTPDKFQIIDADSNFELCQQYGVGSIPTFILIEDSVEVNRMVGAKTKQELEDFLNG